MEAITEGVNNMNLTGLQKKNRIQVSNSKKPLFFYVNLAKRYMQQHNDVELSALGMGGEQGIYEVGLNLMFTGEEQQRNVYCNIERDYPLGVYAFVKLYHRTISTVVSIAEILKNNGLAVEKKIMTSTVDMKDELRGRPVQKAKIEILLGKTEKFDELMAAAREERELGEAEE